jgi:hypothetical protein
MKKTLFLAAIAALVLGSCAKEVIDSPALPENETNAIGFGTFLDRTPNSGIKPLGAVMDQDKLHDDGFTVLAYSTGAAAWASYVSGAPGTPNFMDDQDVTWDGGGSVWVYTPIKYWPKIDASTYGNVSFFGYAPTDGTGITVTGVASSAPKITFVTEEAAANQIDLVADAELDKTKADNPVKFQFEHLLSKIGFTAKLFAEYSGATVTVTSLKVFYKANSVKKDGDYTIADSPGAWTLGSTYLANGTGDVIFSGSEVLDNTSALTAFNLSATDNYLMLLPQTTTDGDIYVELEYSVTAEDNTVETTTAVLDVPAISGGYLMGKAYTYNLVISLDVVVFDPAIDVTEWDDVSPSTINV